VTDSVEKDGDVWIIWIFVIRICFGFCASDLEFGCQDAILTPFKGVI